MMPLRHDKLFARIANFQALHAAARRAVKGKRKKPGAASFFANLEGATTRLGAAASHRRISTKPLRRLRSATIRKSASCRPRPSGTASCIMPSVRSWSRSSRRASSTTPSPIGPVRARIRAIEVYERYRDRHAHVLRCDIYRYFPAIDHAILKSDFRRRIACLSTLALLDLIVDSSNTQEPVNLYFNGDCPSSDNLRLIRHFEKGGSGSSGLEFKRPAVDAASDGLRWWQA